jgi:hypothetical protein
VSWGSSNPTFHCLQNLYLGFFVLCGSSSTTACDLFCSPRLSIIPASTDSFLGEISTSSSCRFSVAKESAHPPTISFLSLLCLPFYNGNYHLVCLFGRLGRCYSSSSYLDIVAFVSIRLSTSTSSHYLKKMIIPLFLTIPVQRRFAFFDHPPSPVRKHFLCLLLKR